MSRPYMPKVIGDRAKEIHYTQEGGGTVATCTGCGWTRWESSRADLGGPAHDHKCRRLRGDKNE